MFVYIKIFFNFTPVKQNQLLTLLNFSIMKKYLLNVLSTFFCEESTFYSVYVMTSNGERPLCKWFRGFNPPRVGEYLAVEVEETTNLPKPEKRFEYYKVVSIANIIYQTKHIKGQIISGKNEATILVKYVGNEKPN